MKNTFFLLMLVSTQSWAESCFDAAKYTRLSPQDQVALCYAAKDSGPVKCYHDSSADLADSDVILLCQGARLDTYQFPNQCFYKIPAAIPTTTALNICAGARNDAPANCFARLNLPERAVTYPARVQISICRHSMDALDSINYFNEASSQASLDKALKLIEAHNEFRY